MTDIAKEYAESYDTYRKKAKTETLKHAKVSKKSARTEDDEKGAETEEKDHSDTEEVKVENVSKKPRLET